MTNVIETPRLILRGWKNEDLEPWAAMNADPRVMEFFPSTFSFDRSEETFHKMRSDLERDGYGWFVVEQKDTHEFLGVSPLVDVSFVEHFTPATEIGWRFAFDAWGRGYATEAATAVTNFAFEVLNRDEIVSMTARLNVRSQKVMQRLGMTTDPSEDFEHPRVEEGHRLRPHVLYRLKRPPNAKGIRG